MARGDVEAIEPSRGADPQSGQVHLGRGQDVRRGAGGGRETEEAAAVAGAPAFTAITVDGCLQLSRRTQTFPLTLEWVEVLHIPGTYTHTHTHGYQKTPGP